MEEQKKASQQSGEAGSIIPLSENELAQALAQSVQSIKRESSDKTFDTAVEGAAVLKQELAQARQEITTLLKKQKALESKKEEYKLKYFHFKSVFQKQTQYFYLYQSLSDHSLEALSGIFKGSSFEEFLACGVQPGNIDALWEFARGEALLQNYEDVKILGQIILYFVKLYNQTNDLPILGIQEVSSGDTFDVDLHIRTQDSKAAGTISEVVLSGLTNAYTGAVIKKSVVTVEG